jgi:hypothetical protein
MFAKNLEMLEKNRYKKFVERKGIILEHFAKKESAKTPIFKFPSKFNL